MGRVSGATQFRRSTFETGLVQRQTGTEACPSSVPGLLTLSSALVGQLSIIITKYLSNSEKKGYFDS